MCVVSGTTDEIGFYAAEDRRPATDTHAAILPQPGPASRKLEVPGRKRLDIDHGSPIKAVIG